MTGQNSFFSHNKTQYFLLFAFLVVNLFILQAKIPDGEVLAGMDTASYVGSARMFIEHGAYVQPSNPEIVKTWNTPFYPLFIAANMVLFGDDLGVDAVILWQIVFLYLTALITYRIVLPHSGLAALVAQAIVLFNPNSLITLHYTQTETLFTLILMAAVYLLFRIGRDISLMQGVLLGALAGLGAMTRPVLFYALLVMPFIIPAVLGVAKTGEGDGKWIRRSFGASLAATLVMAIITLPWVWRNYEETGVATFVSNGGAFLWDQVSELYQVAENPDFANFHSHQLALLDRELGPGWQEKNLPETVISQALKTTALEEIGKQPVSVMAKAFVFSSVRLYGSGGSSNIWKLFGIAEGEAATDSYIHAHSLSSLSQGVFSGITSSSFAYGLLHAVPIVLAVLLRVFGVLGLVEMVRRREWRAFIICVGVLGYFSSGYLFLSASRFRVPLEPVLAILSVYGLTMVMGYFQRKKG